MNKPTPGPWKITANLNGHMEFPITDEKGLSVAGVVARSSVKSGYGEKADALSRTPMGQKEAWKNAALIVAAVNSCFAINPSNPQAVAEALPGLVRAAKAVYADHIERFSSYPDAEGQENRMEKMDDLKSALAKLEAK